MKHILSSAAVGLALAVGFASPLAAKTLVYCSEGSPENFNPQINTTGTTFDASSETIYNRLVEFERGATKVVPGLAESWTTSPDGLEWTFTLRKGVKWHTTPWFTPSREFNADDVLFTFNRMWKTDHPYHTVSGGNYSYFNDMGFPDLLESIEKVDDYTIRIRLSQPDATFLPNLAMDFASIMSAEYGDKLQAAGTLEQIDQQPVGTGPFVLVNYQKDAVIRYAAHPDYWEGKAPLDQLVFSITPDASVRAQKFLAGECHVVAWPNPEDLPALAADPNTVMLKQEGLNIGYLALHTQKKPFDDKRVRQALNMAIDKKAIVQAVYGEAGVPATNPIPPTIWSYNASVQDYPYDPEKAKQLLAEAGYPNGFETDLWWMPVSRPYNPNAQRIAELMQSDLAKVGVNAKLVSYEWGEYRKRAQAGEHQMAQLGWTGDNGDPDNFLGVLLGCNIGGGGEWNGANNSNIAKFCHPEFQDLLDQARQSTDVAERTKLYEQAQVIFKEEAPWFTIAHSVVNQPVKKNVVDYRVDPFGGHRFYGVDLTE